MTELELIERARGVLIRRLKVNPAAVTPDVAIVDLGADSLDLLMMAGEFEELFSVDISTKEIKEIRTFGDIIQRLWLKLGTAV
jgi:acyl carrier protein